MTQVFGAFAEPTATTIANTTTITPTGGTSLSPAAELFACIRRSQAMNLADLLGPNDEPSAEMELICEWLDVDTETVEAYIEAKSLTPCAMYLRAKEVRPRPLDSPEEKIRRAELKRSLWKFQRK